MRKLIVYGALYAATIGIIASLFVLEPLPRTPVPLVRTIIIVFATILLLKYFMYMLISPLYDVWRERHRARFRDAMRAYSPLVSVIVPAWNERVGVLQTVRSVLESTYAPLEVIVINDGSTDSSDAIIRAFQDELAQEPDRYPGKTLVYRYKENGGKGKALNEGIAVSMGEIVVSIDADCYVTPDAIANLVPLFADPSIMAVVGNVKIGNTKSILGTVQYLEFLFAFYFKKADTLLNTIYIIGGAAGAFRREVFGKVGMYDTLHITEDIDLSVRMQEAGMRIVYAADAVVYTEGANSLKGLMKQRLRWKHGRFKTFWDHRSLFFSRREGRSRALTFLILPLALFGDSQLFAEVTFLIFLYAYSWWAHDFSSFVSGIVVVSAMFAVQMFDNGKESRRLSFLALAPIGWLLFYVSTYVEHMALLKSFWAWARGRSVGWQRWKRRGVLDSQPVLTTTTHEHIS